MSQQTKHPESGRSTVSVCAVAIAVAVMATTSACSKAPEPAKHETTASEPMNHSKMDGMSMTGDTDYDFAVNMRMHHQMAVDMSEAELKNGKDPQLLQMAKDIIAAQKNEIVVIDQWLEAHKSH